MKFIFFKKNTKTIISTIVAVLVAIIATINVNLNTNREILSDLFKANVEALAQFEFPEFPGGDGDLWCNVHCVYSPGRCWFKSLPYYWDDCQPSGIPTDYCKC